MSASSSFPLSAKEERSKVSISGPPPGIEERSESDEEDGPKSAGFSAEPSSMHHQYPETPPGSWKTASFFPSWRPGEDPLLEEDDETLSTDFARVALAQQAELAAMKADDLEKQAAQLRVAAQNCRDMAQIQALTDAYSQGKPLPGPGGYHLPPPGMLLPSVGAPQQQPVRNKDRTEESSVNHAADLNSSEKTTVMWRNIPNNYSRDDLLELINNEGFTGAYNFFYSPVDFTSNALLGYAFVNFVTNDEAKRFLGHFQGYQRWSLTSEKIAEVTWSDPLQGLEGHIERYRNSPVMHKDISDDKKPLLFEAGQRIIFPAPTKKIRAPHVRGCLQKTRAAKRGA